MVGLVGGWSGVHVFCAESSVSAPHAAADDDDDYNSDNVDENNNRIMITHTHTRSKYVAHSSVACVRVLFGLYIVDRYMRGR